MYNVIKSNTNLRRDSCVLCSYVLPCCLPLPAQAQSTKVLLCKIAAEIQLSQKVAVSTASQSLVSVTKMGNWYFVSMARHYNLSTIDKKAACASALAAFLLPATTQSDTLCRHESYRYST